MACARPVKPNGVLESDEEEEHILRMEKRIHRRQRHQHQHRHGRLHVIVPRSTNESESPSSRPNSRWSSRLVSSLGNPKLIILPQNNHLVVTTNLCFSTCYCCLVKVRSCTFLAHEGYVSPNHCLISYVNGGYVVRDLESEKGTFVNGEKLVPYLPQRLINGDILSFGLSHNDPIPSLKKHRIAYYFEDPNMDAETALEPESEPMQTQNEELEISPLVESILGNYLLLSEILSSLDLRDLKNARLVCKQWNKESSRWFYAKSLQTLPGNFPGKECTRWDFLKEPGVFSTTTANLSVELPDICETRKMWTQEDRQEKIEHINSFLTNNGEWISSLDLKNFHELIGALSSLPSLSCLKELALDIEAQVTEGEDSWVEKLPKGEFSHAGLQSLNIHFTGYGIRSQSQTQPHLGRKMDEFLCRIITRFPSLHELSFPGDLASEVMDTLTDNPTLLRGILTFFISFNLFGNRCSEEYRKIAHMPFQPLRGLGLEDLCPLQPKPQDQNEGNENDAEDVEVGANAANATSPAQSVTEAIEKFSSTLDYLWLNINNTSTFFPGIYEDDLLTYTIPCCPELKYLGFRTYQEHQADKKIKKNIGTSGVQNPHCWCNFKDSDGAIHSSVNYSLFFPKLETLEITDTGAYQPGAAKLFGSKALDPFFPREGGVRCESLRRLILPKLWRKWSDPEYQAWLTRLTEIFPNVHSFLFRAVRKGEFHLLEDDKNDNDEEKDSSSEDESGGLTDSSEEESNSSVDD